jgi:hypothetical protein
MADDYGRAAAVQTDGKLVVGGYTGTPFGGSFALVRYTTNNTMGLSI